MRAKSLIELLTLSTNLYIISKDEKFMENMAEMTQKGKEKLKDFIDSGEGGEGELAQKIFDKASEVKEQIEKKMEEVAQRVYEKMQIAHVNQVKSLELEISELKKELALTEAKLANLELRK